jgi:23S rRNA (pseudouridine1915-N3)-methyltransferase
MRIQLLFLGKTRRAEIRALLDDYVARLRRYAEIEIRELRADSGASMKRLEFSAGATLVLLDAEGRKLNSQQFAEWIGSCRDRGGRVLVFLCGTSTGFPESLARRATQRISLSALTFSHELARVMLKEQIYRAFALLAGHPYPK